MKRRNFIKTILAALTVTKAINTEPKKLNLNELWNPSEKQLKFLETPIDKSLILYGGNAGGGKTERMRYQYYSPRITSRVDNIQIPEGY